MLVPLFPNHVRYEDHCLIVQRINLIERLSIRFLKQPDKRKIKLDKFGAFVAERLTGQKSVEEIVSELQSAFGEEAEPTVPRLAKFLEILEANEWLKWK